MVQIYHAHTHGYIQHKSEVIITYLNIKTRLLPCANNINTQKDNILLKEQMCNSVTTTSNDVITGRREWHLAAKIRTSHFQLDVRGRWRFYLAPWFSICLLKISICGNQKGYVLSMQSRRWRVLRRHEVTSVVNTMDTQYLFYSTYNTIYRSLTWTYLVSNPLLSSFFCIFELSCLRCLSCLS